MANKKGTALIIITLLVGLAGLGLGIFSIVRPEKINDSLDQNIYYCSTQSEIEYSLNSIGNGNGEIILTENITLTSSLNLDYGGKYSIRGAGHITLFCSGTAFNITNTQYFQMENIGIDSSSNSNPNTHSIMIAEENNNLVYLQNIRINGGKGRGISVFSQNVWIENCYITNIGTGIYLGNGSGNCQILSNSITELHPDSDEVYGVFLQDSSYNVISSNLISHLSSHMKAYGVFSNFSSYTTFSDNIVSDILGINNSTSGIYIYGYYSNTILDGNIVCRITGWCVSLLGCLFTSCTNNIFANCTDGGIYLDVIAWYNTIVGNTLYSLPIPVYIVGDYNIFSNNQLFGCGAIYDGGLNYVYDNY